jgi:hypothetical protein
LADPAPSNIPDPSTCACRVCRRPIDPGDRYCRWCGRHQTDVIDWHYRPWAIAALALLFLGPFAIPLVWRSPYLARRDRWIATALIALYTLLLLYACHALYVIVMDWAGQLLDAQSLA